MSERVLGQKHRNLEACERKKIVRCREKGTTIRQIWLADVWFVPKKTRRSSTIPHELLATALRYCAGKDDKVFFPKG